MSETILPPRERKAANAVSMFIAAVLGLQAAASIGVVKERLWPFLSYPMYRKAHRAGEPVTRYVLVAIFSNGNEARVRPEDIHMNEWQFLRGPVSAVRTHDAAMLLRHAEWLTDRLGRRPAALRLEDHPLALSAGGVVSPPSRVVAVVSLEDKAVAR